MNAPEAAAPRFIRHPYARHTTLCTCDATDCDSCTCYLAWDGIPRLDALLGTAHVEQGPHRIEQGHGAAHENHAVSVLSGGQHHLHPRTNRLRRLYVHLVDRPLKALGFHVAAKKTKAVIAHLGHRSSVEVSDDNRNGESLLPNARCHDGQLNAADGRQQGADDTHDISSDEKNTVNWPGASNTESPADWSPLKDHDAIVHRDQPVA